MKICPDGIKHDNFSVGVMLLSMYTGRACDGYFTESPETSRECITIIQGALDQLQPQPPIARVIRGLLCADAKDRMSFADALQYLNKSQTLSLQQGVLRTVIKKAFTS